MSLLTYFDLKEPFMVALLERAMTWRDSLGNSREPPCSAFEIVSSVTGPRQ
jgi:hypothetical protein